MKVLDQSAIFTPENVKNRSISGRKGTFQGDQRSFSINESSEGTDEKKNSIIDTPKEIK